MERGSERYDQRIQQWQRFRSLRKWELRFCTSGWLQTLNLFLLSCIFEKGCWCLHILTGLSNCTDFKKNSKDGANKCSQPWCLCHTHQLLPFFVKPVFIQTPQRAEGCSALLNFFFCHSGTKNAKQIQRKWMFFSHFITDGTMCV